MVRYRTRVQLSHPNVGTAYSKTWCPSSHPSRKVERGDRRTKIESGPWLDKYNQQSLCEVSSVILDSMRNPPPWNIKMYRRVCCATNFYPVGQESVRVWDALIIKVKQHNCAWFSGCVTAWEYAGLAFQSIALMFTYREHLTSIHTKCEVDSLRLYRCLQTSDKKPDSEAARSFCVKRINWCEPECSV